MKWPLLLEPLDKGLTNNYMLTVELLDVSDGKETQVSTKVLSIEGETVFDAVRSLFRDRGREACRDISGFWLSVRKLPVRI